MGNVANGLDDAGKHGKHLLKKGGQSIFWPEEGGHFRG
jgi:hypothetical protein